MDHIEIRGLRVWGHHGVSPAEQCDGQPFVVDLTLERDLTAPAASDDLADTVDYATVAEHAARAIRETRFSLIEALAGHLAELCLAEATVTAVDVRVAKPAVDLALELTEVAVSLRREQAAT